MEERIWRPEYLINLSVSLISDPVIWLAMELVRVTGHCTLSMTFLVSTPKVQSWGIPLIPIKPGQLVTQTVAQFSCLLNGTNYMLLPQLCESQGSDEMMDGKILSAVFWENAGGWFGSTTKAPLSVGTCSNTPSHLIGLESILYSVNPFVMTQKAEWIKPFFLLPLYLNTF